MSQRRFRQIERGEDDLMSAPFQLEHFRIAKRL
jgi:hypothetical protein